jgi:hypothetical protein
MPAVPMSSADRVREAWQRRADSDYFFNFGTALGWTLLTCGIYQIYIVYQLIRRDRDHNLRRIELLDGATNVAWEQAQARRLDGELRPNFERVASHMQVLRNQTTQFRDPTVWMVLAIVARGIVEYIAFILIDGDLMTHDRAEGAVEAELVAIYGRLGTQVVAPDPNRLKKAPHNYVARVLVSILTCGIYTFWWEYDVMTEGNRHFVANWEWEDSLATAVQQLAAA